MINIVVTKTLSTLLSIQKYFLQKINNLFCINYIRFLFPYINNFFYYLIGLCDVPEIVGHWKRKQSRV